MRAMIKVSLITVFFIFSFSVSAADRYSAYRDLNTDYTHYESKYDKSLRRTPLGTSTRYDEASLPKATAWTSVSIMQTRFEQMRDIRFLIWRPKPEVLRRISWNYPEDGCYARAALAMKNIFQWFMPLPKKVFVFGNLRVKTQNSSRGVVGWWYHVAPIVEVEGVKFVLDPAIERSQPLKLVDWLSRMGRPEKMKVAICGSGSYFPGDNCDKESDGLELRAERDQQYYLGLEWSHMGRLGRQAEL